MDLKKNVNSLHNSLIEKFDSVDIQEKSNKEFGNYIELCIIKEGRSLIALISKDELESSNFNWKYYSNPNIKDHLVERISNVVSFYDDVRNIFDNNRFSQDYIVD